MCEALQQNAIVPAKVPKYDFKPIPKTTPSATITKPPENINDQENQQNLLQLHLQPLDDAPADDVLIKLLENLEANPSTTATPSNSTPGAQEYNEYQQCQQHTKCHRSISLPTSSDNVLWEKQHRNHQLQLWSKIKTPNKHCDTLNVIKKVINQQYIS